MCPFIFLTTEIQSKKHLLVGEMVQLLKALTVIPKGLDLDSQNPQQAAHNSLSL